MISNDCLKRCLPGLSGKVILELEGDHNPIRSFGVSDVLASPSLLVRL